MGRFDVYDSDELPSSEHSPSSDGHVRDTATEVGYEFAAQIPFLATHCRFDRDDDLIYGDEVELVHVDGEPLRLAIPNQGPRFETPLKVVTTTDKQWRLAWLHHCSWPYSINYRQIGRIRTYAKKAKPDSFWATTVERLQRGAGLIEATESHPFDPFVHVNSSGKRTSPPMKGYMRPDRRHDELFSNETGNSERQKLTRRMEAPDDQDELARRLGLPKQVRLWGICADKDLQKAHDYLRKELKDLYDDAKAGLIRRKYLYLTKRLSLKKYDLDGMELPEAVPPPGRSNA